MDWRKYFYPNDPSPAVAATIRRLVVCKSDPQLPTLYSLRILPLTPEQGARLLLIASRNVLRQCTDPAIIAAHEFLKDNGELAPPLNRIRLADLTDRNLHGVCDRGNIEIDPSSSFYRAAQQGDLLPLAMLLHHEGHHALVGGSEAETFAASLQFLQRHNATQALIDQVTNDALNVSPE